MHDKKDVYRIYNESSLPYKTVETISFLWLSLFFRFIYSDSKIHINTIIITTCAVIDPYFEWWLECDQEVSECFILLTIFQRGRWGFINCFLQFIFCSKDMSSEGYSNKYFTRSESLWITYFKEYAFICQEPLSWIFIHVY